LRRINITITCIYTNCTYLQPITIVGDSPIIVTNLITGQYKIELSIADTTEANDTIVGMITMSDDDNGPINRTVVKMINKCTSASTNDPTNPSMHIDT